jgi:hypothetical protein
MKRTSLSLFAFGVNSYTQRHKDSKDIVGGLAGPVTLGHYTRENTSDVMLLSKYLITI